VTTGIADGAWLTADFDGQQVADCRMVPPELREAGSTGRYRASEASIGEITCEGLHPGAATLRLRARARMLTSNGSTSEDCDCIADWRVELRVLVDGQTAVSIEGTPGDRSADGSCRRGPDIDRSLAVAVGADGRLHARIELTHCDRSSTTSCLFLRGTGVEVAQ
jgi:hypothetical protein